MSPACNSAAALKVLSITAKTSGDSSRRVSAIIFAMIQESFTTQGLPGSAAEREPPHVRVKAL